MTDPRIEAAAQPIAFAVENLLLEEGYNISSSAMEKLKRLSNTVAKAALAAADRAVWRPISEARKDGTKFIGRNGDEYRTTWAGRYYEKWPHQEGGPTYRYAWDYEALAGIFQWNPTHFQLLPPPPTEETE